MSILKFLLFLFKLLKITLMLLFSHGPLFFCETSIATSSEEGIIMIINADTVSPAACGPIRIVKVNIIDNTITIPIKVFEDIIEIEITSQTTTLAINSSMNSIAVNRILIIVIVHVWIIMVLSDRIIIFVHDCMSRMWSILGFEVGILIFDTFLTLIALSL